MESTILLEIQYSRSDQIQKSCQIFWRPDAIWNCRNRRHWFVHIVDVFLQPQFYFEMASVCLYFVSTSASGIMCPCVPPELVLMLSSHVDNKPWPVAFTVLWDMLILILPPDKYAISSYGFNFLGQKYISDVLRKYSKIRVLNQNV